MPVAIGLWSLELKPGKPEVVEPQADVRITNVALSDMLDDKSGRSTVKVSYSAPGQIDSDDDEEKETPNELTKTILCSLTAGQLEQTTTDIILDSEEEYIFEVIGQNIVYLTGNYIDQRSVDEPPFEDSDDDLDLEDAYDLREVSSDVEMDPAELDGMDSDTSRFQEVEDEPPKSTKRPRESDAPDADATKPSKADKKKLKGEGGKPVAVPELGGEKQEKRADKKQEKSEGVEGKKNKPAASGLEREITGGIKILDSKVGAGPMAKKGNTVLMRYIGKLQNGKVFDQNTKGKPFTFHLGKGEVIKGWDEGIVGMQVGGERRLTIPPTMAYGKKGTDGIPKNSTLIFEVKLMEIKQ